MSDTPTTWPGWLRAYLRDKASRDEILSMALLVIDDPASEKRDLDLAERAIEVFGQAPIRPKDADDTP